MRVAIWGPITWRVPPRHYGPWEQVVGTLADGLARRGVEVTLFASGDSRTAARLKWVVPRPLAEDPGLDPKVYEFLHIGYCLAQAGEFDIIHNHLNCYPLCFTPLLSTPVVTTLHGSALLEPATRVIYRRFKDLPYISISNAERAGLPELNYVATVYNGLNLEDFTFNPKPADYLLFLGRISPKKGTHLAIHMARQLGERLVIAGYVPPDEEAYFAEKIKPELGGRIEYIGPVGPKERNPLLGGAKALLHLITVPEPFGLVMAEAQACGTPVIGINAGSVAEVVEHGVTGFVVSNLQEATLAVEKLPQIDRRACRQRAEKYFSAEAMVQGYWEVYQKVLQEKAG